MISSLSMIPFIYYSGKGICTQYRTPCDASFFCGKKLHKSAKKCFFPLESTCFFCYTDIAEDKTYYSMERHGVFVIMRYQTKGTCSSFIDIEVENDAIKSVEFFGGCNGNLKGISALVTGMKIDDAISKLKGIRCGFKPTSCPDQLAQALEGIRSGNF